MPELCTCGAQLPEDARFCHKCGKPQRESDVAELAVHEPLVPQPPVVHVVTEPVVRRPAYDPTIGFRNPLIVRTALLASILGFVVFGIVGQISSVAALVVMVGAGLFAVWLYRRRTGQRVTVRGGVHIGWMTGLFAFVTSMILVTLMAVALMDRNFASVFESQLGARSSQEIARQVLDAFRTPKGLADIITSFFVACGLMPMLGGALGALLGRRSG